MMVVVGPFAYKTLSGLEDLGIYHNTCPSVMKCMYCFPLILDFNCPVH